MKNGTIKIYLGDLTHETVTVSSDTMPLNVGFLAANLKKQFKHELEIQLFKSPMEVLQAIKEQPPDILGFSNYCWNLELSYFILDSVKTKNPNVLTVMGGPNFPKTSEGQYSFLTNRPAIDLYVFQEGELSFCSLIGKMMNNGMDVNKIKREPVEGCLHLSPETGSLLAGGLYPRIKALDELPSPYLDGFMDKFFKTNLNPFIQTNRGCPFTCTFCHEGEQYYSGVNSFSVDRVVEELDYISHHIQSQSVLSIADSNFGMYKRDVEICKKIRQIQDLKHYPRHINVTTGKNRPDTILEAITTLEKGTLIMLASVQSLEPTVLENIKRKNIEWNAYIDIQQRLHEMDPDYTSMAEVIIPLPGETRESFFESIRKLIDAGVDAILPYTLMMLNGTYLSSKEERDKYGYTTKYRIIPRGFGEYDGSKLMEIEEVGVAHRDMPFEDYKLCRKMACLLSLVYNRKSFKELFKYLKESNIDIFEYLLFCYNNTDQAPSKVKQLFDDFLVETEEELWDSREELLAFYNHDKNFEKLISGEIGGNLLQKYWVRGVGFNFKPLADYIFDMALSFISNCQELDDRRMEEISLELNEIKKYTLIVRDNLFDIVSEMKKEEVHAEFDIVGWIQDKNNKILKEFKGGKQFNVSVLPEQRALLKGLLRQYGTGNQAIGKISTRVNIGNLERQLSHVA